MKVTSSTPKTTLANCSMIKISVKNTFDTYYIHRELHDGWHINKNRYQNVMGDYLKKFKPTKQDCLKTVLDIIGGPDQIERISFSNERYI